MRIAGPLILVLLLAVSCGNRDVRQSGGDDGVQRCYWDNGKLKSELRYADGELNGNCLWYYNNGQLEKDCWYKYGQLDSVYTTWYESGQLFQDGQYADGMMDGSWLVFYPDGSLAAKAQYDKGSGKQTGYNADGCVVFEAFYLNNEKHGCETRYAPDGRVLQVTEYEHGKKVTR